MQKQTPRELHKEALRINELFMRMLETLDSIETDESRPQMYVRRVCVAHLVLLAGLQGLASCTAGTLLKVPRLCVLFDHVWQGRVSTAVRSPPSPHAFTFSAQRALNALPPLLACLPPCGVRVRRREIRKQHVVNIQQRQSELDAITSAVGV